MLAGGAVALFCLFGTSILVPDTMAGGKTGSENAGAHDFSFRILGVFRGYFQAYRNMMPTSLSQIIEQIFVAVFALLMSGVMLGQIAGKGRGDGSELGGSRSYHGYRSWRFVSTAFYGGSLSAEPEKYQTAPAKRPVLCQ